MKSTTLDKFIGKSQDFINYAVLKNEPVYINCDQNCRVVLISEKEYTKLLTAFENEQTLINGKKSIQAKLRQLLLDVGELGESIEFKRGQ